MPKVTATAKVGVKRAELPISKKTALKSAARKMLKSGDKRAAIIEHLRKADARVTIAVATGIYKEASLPK